MSPYYFFESTPLKTWGVLISLHNYSFCIYPTLPIYLYAYLKSMVGISTLEYEKVKWQKGQTEKAKRWYMNQMGIK